MFFKIIDACFHYGIFKMTNRIYEMMMRYEVPVSDQIQLRFFEHNRKEIRSKGKRREA